MTFAGGAQVGDGSEPVVNRLPTLRLTGRRRGTDDDHEEDHEDAHRSIHRLSFHNWA
jgi:hypothetical protein